MENVLEFFDELGPEKVIHFYNADSGLKAILVIDNSIFGPAAGGIRMQSDITVEEMIRLARMMTYKFITYELPMGGAKSGIWLDPRSANRDKMIKEFAFEIKPFIKYNLYFPGPDMGTYLYDIEKILQISDREDLITKTSEEKKFGLEIEETFTGYGVIMALEILLKNNKEKLRGKKIAIEGFGKVGSSTALFLDQMGAKVVAISTINGGIYNDNGLNIKSLINLKSKYGDDLVKYYENAEKISKEALFKLPADVLIPGARADVINKENINDIKAKYIIPAANIPFSPEIIPSLNQMKFHVIPDFVANVGEILATAARFTATDSNAIYNNIKSVIQSKITDLIKIANEKHISIFDAALKNCKKMIKRKFKRKSKKRQLKISKIFN